MRKKFASVGASFVDGTEIAVKEDAAVFVAFEDAAFVFGFNGIFADEFGFRDAQEMREAFSVAFGDLGGGDAAAVGASGAIDLLFDPLGDGFEPTLDKVVAFEPGAELLVIRALLFAETFDLDKIGEHYLPVSQ